MFLPVGATGGVVGIDERPVEQPQAELLPQDARHGAVDQRDRQALPSATLSMSDFM